MLRYVWRSNRHTLGTRDDGPSALSWWSFRPGICGGILDATIRAALAHLWRRAIIRAGGRHGQLLRGSQLTTHVPLENGRCDSGPACSGGNMPSSRTDISQAVSRAAPHRWFRKAAERHQLDVDGRRWRNRTRDGQGRNMTMSRKHHLEKGGGGERFDAIEHARMRPHAACSYLR